MKVLGITVIKYTSWFNPELPNVERGFNPDLNENGLFNPAFTVVTVDASPA